MTVRIAFPVLFASLRLHLDKGRQWSVVEHLILLALCKEPRTAAGLSVSGKIPRRLVIEVVIRLMRAGWVELVGIKEQVGFRATGLGLLVAKKDTLPAVTKPISRKASFAIDKISGTVFRSRDLTLYTPNRLEKLKQKGDVIVLPPAPEIPRRSADEIIDFLLDDDEQYRGADPNGARYVDWHAVVTVHGNSIEGLSTRAPELLRGQILAAAQGRNLETRTSYSVMASVPPASQVGKVRDIAFDSNSLILGAKSHKSTFENMLRKACSRVVIHSTFIRAERFRVFLPVLSDAARRGAKIDILWGQGSPTEEANRTAAEVERCQSMLEDQFLRERIRVHGFTTNSHAKVFLADDGRGQMVGVIGSCNWFYSNFENYEASARFVDPLMVADIASSLSTLAGGPYGNWSSLTRDLAGLASNLRRSPRPNSPRVRAALVLGAEHNDYIQRARDEAQHRIVVGSHRLGGSANTAILVPTRAAVKAHNVDVTIYYGTSSGPVNGVAAAEITRDVGSAGISLRRIYRPRLHAKFLAWDDNYALITSQNWLSADPPDHSPHAEIGVYLSGVGLGRHVIEHASNALSVS